MLNVLSKSLEDKNIKYIVPNTTIVNKNIIDCEKEFDIKMLSTGENLSQLSKIAEVCDIIIAYDIGGCFYYISSKSDYSLVLHFAGSDFYYNNLKESNPVIRSKFINCPNDTSTTIASRIKEEILLVYK